MTTQSPGGSFQGVMIAAAIGFGIFMGYPMLTESTGNSCLALEKRALGGVANLDDGRAAEQSARRALPDLPSPFACTYLYWKSLAGK